MPSILTRINCAKLNGRQQKNYNILKLSAALADYGFVTSRLTEDRPSTDFIVQHLDGQTSLKILLKGRLYFEKKFRGKNLHIAFLKDTDWYLYPHDELLEKVLATTNVGKTSSWIDKGVYHYPSLSKQMIDLLKPYRVI